MRLNMRSFCRMLIVIPVMMLGSILFRIIGIKGEAHNIAGAILGGVTTFLVVLWINKSNTPSECKSTQKVDETIGECNKVRLEKLQEIFENGLIEEAEYKAKKQDILNNL